MATKRELIAQAYEEIGYASYTYDLLPEQIQSALTKLQQMAAEWDGIGIRVGYDVDAGLNDDSGLPDYAQYAYAANLGVRLAPSVGKALSPDFRVLAKSAYDSLLATSQTLPTYQFPGTLPLGRGNRQSTRMVQYFQPSETVDTGSDSVLDI